MNTIPRKIHQIHVNCNDPELSEFYSSLSQSWKNNHPDWEYKLWEKETINLFILTEFPHLYTLLNKNTVSIQNIIRYLILYKEGGIFVDNDYECIEPFDDLIKKEQFYLSISPDNQKKLPLLDSLIISRKGHPFLEFLLSQLTENIGLLKEGRHLFINKVFSQYREKHAIKILPFQKITPCTKDEIKLFLKGLISEDEVEDKISEALCICYYKKNKTVNKATHQESTEVLYLSSFAAHHGASIAAYRIHTGLRKLGVNSKMLVLESAFTPKTNLSEEIHIALPEGNELYGYQHEMKPTKAYPKDTTSLNSFAPSAAGVHIDKYIKDFNPEIIQLHFINAGFITIEETGKIRKKIVWRLPDCWAFTGGCYYFGDCKRYITGCGKCPKLGSDSENDLSKEIWGRKEKAWNMIDITVVVPTLWMKKMVESSVLLKGRNVYVIPNGLDLDEFYPINKITARRALNLPLDKRIILYGATNALNDPRKGFSLLLEALQILAEKHKDDYYFLIFGSETQPINLAIPTKFLGRLYDNYILQLAYSAADVMVVPSLEEAFGQTVIEAMACATPVVSFWETGPDSIIDHLENGYLAQYANAIDLAHGIEWTLNSDELNFYLSNSARRKVETTYDIALIARQHKRLYQELISGVKIESEKNKVLTAPPIYEKFHSAFRKKENTDEYIQRYKITDKDKEELMQAVEKEFPDFAARIRRQCMYLKEKDLYFCCLCKIGITSPTYLKNFFNVTADAIGVRKKRLNKKLFGKEENPKFFDRYICSL